MIDLQADDWFEIKNRGWVASFGSGYQLPEDMLTPYLLRGVQVNIDGKEYTVKGVEMFMIGGCYEKYPRSYGFGLLVGDR